MRARRHAGIRRSRTQASPLINRHGAVFLLSVYLISLVLLTLGGISLQRSMTETQAASLSTQLQQAFYLAEGGVDRVISQLKTQSLAFQEGVPFPCGSFTTGTTTCTVRTVSNDLGLQGGSQANLQTTLYQVNVTATTTTGQSTALTTTLRSQQHYTGIVAGDLVQINKDHWLFDDPPITIFGDIRTSVGTVHAVELHGATVNGNVTIGPPAPSGSSPVVPAYTQLVSTPPNYNQDGIYLAPASQGDPSIAARVTGTIGAHVMNASPPLSIPANCHYTHEIVLEQPGSYTIQRSDFQDGANLDTGTLSVCTPVVYVAHGATLTFEQPTDLYVTGEGLVQITGEYRKGSYLFFNDGQITVAPQVASQPDLGLTVIAPLSAGQLITPPLFMGNFTGSVYAPASYVDVARAAGDQERPDLTIPPQRKLGFVVAKQINVAGADITFSNAGAPQAASSNPNISVLSWQTGTSTATPMTLAMTSTSTAGAPVYFSANASGGVPDGVSTSSAPSRAGSVPATTPAPAPAPAPVLPPVCPGPDPRCPPQQVAVASFSGFSGAYSGSGGGGGGGGGTGGSTSSTMSGDGGINSVICTELYRQGAMPSTWFAADMAFGRAYADQRTFMVYHAWGKPTVWLMQHSRFVTSLIRPLGLAWAQHMAYVMGVREQENRLGWWLTKLGLPVHQWLGQYVGLLLSEQP